MHVQNIIARYTNIAMELDNRVRLNKNETIDAGPLNVAKTNSDQVRNKISFAIGNMSSEAYTQAPLTYNLFITTTFNQNSPKDKRPGDRKDSPKPPKDAKRDDQKNDKNKQNNNTDPHRNVGLLTYTGSGRVPNCDYTFIHPITKSWARLCIGHNFRSRTCKFDKRLFFHVDKLSDMNAADKTALVKYVNDTPDLAFASGAGPSPGTVWLSSTSFPPIHISNI